MAAARGRLLVEKEVMTAHDNGNVQYILQLYEYFLAKFFFWRVLGFFAHASGFAWSDAAVHFKLFTKSEVLIHFIIPDERVLMLGNYLHV